MDTAETFFDRQGVDYDYVVDNCGWNGPENSFSALYPFVKRNDLIIEFGVGTGTCASLFLKAGCRYKGLELSSGMIEEARKKFGMEVDLIKHDLARGPYPLADQEADHIVCTGTSYWVSDFDLIHSEARRVLKKDGLFFVDYMRMLSPKNAEIRTGTISAMDIDVYFRTSHEFEESLKSNGFDIVRQTSYYLHEDAIGIQRAKKPEELYFQGLLCKGKAG